MWESVHHSVTRRCVLDRIESMVDRLTGIAEDLNDLSMSILSEAIANGERDRPALEKQMSQARRAVEKAILHLSASRTD
jgi:hypothetical protein